VEIKILIEGTGMKERDRLLSISVFSYSHMLRIIETAITDLEPPIHNITLYNMDGFTFFEDQFETLQENPLLYLCDGTKDFPILQYMKEFNILSQLGKGAFGKVFLGILYLSNLW
jgi:hypothetical protein